MSENKTVEKKAMTEADRAKYIKAAILAAVASAGISEFVRNNRENKIRSKDINPENSRSAIVVPIKKTKFLEELPTPRELAESRGEQIGRVNSMENTPAIENSPVQENAHDSEVMSPEQIAAKKNEILANGRKFNFFGKHAAAKFAQEDSVKKENCSEKKKGEKTDEDKGRILFRDQEGKFVSPNDPVAVAQSEKSASIKGLLDSVIHPIDTVENNFEAAFDKPVAFTAGALGTIYLAAKISDAINERRREKAKERLERARDEYVGILEGEEKKADFDIDLQKLPGQVVGGAFFIPAAMAALVTSKIIENRKIEKKKQKEMSDSYPDDPIILYKTSSAEEIPISPETALVAIMIKRAMIMNFEKSESVVVKSAAGGWFDQMTEWGAKKYYGTRDPLTIDDPEMKKSIDTAIGYFDKPENASKYLGMIQDYEKGDFESAKGKFKEMVPPEILKQNAKYYLNPGFGKALSGYGGFHDSIIKHYNDESYNDTFGKDKSDRISKALTFGGTFNEGGAIHKILFWLANTLGLGNGIFNAQLKNTLTNNSSAGSANPPAGQTVTPGQTIPIAQTQEFPNARGKGSTIIAR